MAENRCEITFLGLFERILYTIMKFLNSSSILNSQPSLDPSNSLNALDALDPLDSLELQLHQEVFRRFIRMPYGHFLDYADDDGHAVIPTAEECRNIVPNMPGWWTPIENGAFFGGLYLRALIKRYEEIGCWLKEKERLAKDILIIERGLESLQDIGVRDGFIARGVADDGISHYPSSSEDQVVPWIMGMVAFMNSDLCQDKGTVRERLLRTLNGLRKENWSIPCDYEDLTIYSNGWGNSTDFRGVCKYLYCTRLLAELTEVPEDLRTFEDLRDGKPADCIYTRKEIVAHGFAHDMVRSTGLIQFWIDVCAHLALIDLAAWDPALAGYYDAGRKANGVTALTFTDDIAAYDNARGDFDPDWHKMLDEWMPFNGSLPENIAMALRQNKIWMAQVVPHRRMEHDILGNALFAAWIALTSGDRAIMDEACRKLDLYLPDVQFGTLHNCYAFAMESCLIYAHPFCGRE